MPIRPAEELAPHAAEISVSSADGRSFEATAPPAAGLRVGDYLTFSDASGSERLALIERTSLDHDGEQAFGSILTGGAAATGSILQSPARASTAGQVSEFLAGRPPGMRFGRLVGDAEVEVGLVGSRFNRHTFWCGQSGSGKTYALGVALEQVLLHTRLPVVIFDPNSDFVRLDEPRSGAPAEVRERLAALDVRILRPGDGDGSLRVRFRAMTPAARAAILRLDPVIDRSEYNALLRLAPALAADPSRIPDALRAERGAGGEWLAERIENLEIFGWRCWAFDFASATDVVAERPAATVLDLGGFRRVEEQLSVALAVLDELWERREERRPVLLVIDEAHNLCAPQMESLLGRALRDRIIQIAAEGRKFGLWLLLSTQRPSKVHPQIVSQCDNLSLMRMNSPGDLAELADVFGFVPPAMLAQSARFRQGEALLAGGFVAAPSIVKVRDRITVEGGIDVPVPMPA